MKRENINYLLVGIFVLVMFGLLMMVLYRITGRGADTDPYYVVYSNIAGLNIGTAVTYGGYQVGQVQEVLPQRQAGKTKYKLHLAIKEGWKIPSDSVARIVSPGLLSDNLIDIQEGGSDQFLSPGATIEGQEEISMMTLLNNMAYELQTLSQNSIQPLLDNINKQVEVIGAQLGTQIPQLSANANDLLSRLKESAEALKDLLNEENRGHVASMLRNADNLSQEMVDLSAGFGELRSDLDRLLADANDLVNENRGDVRRSMRSLRQSLDTISNNINTIVYNLEAASRNMNEFSRQIRQNPGLLMSSPSPASGEEVAQ